MIRIHATSGDDGSHCYVRTFIFIPYVCTHCALFSLRILLSELALNVNNGGCNGENATIRFTCPMNLVLAPLSKSQQGTSQFPQHNRMEQSGTNIYFISSFFRRLFVSTRDFLWGLWVLVSTECVFSIFTTRNANMLTLLHKLEGERAKWFISCTIERMIGCIHDRSSLVMYFLREDNSQWNNSRRRNLIRNGTMESRYIVVFVFL